LVEARTNAQRRLYRVRTEPLREIDEWLAPSRAQWQHALVSPDTQLHTIACHHVSHRPLTTPRHDGVIMSDLAVLQESDGRTQLVFTRKLAHAQDKVWRAVSDPEQHRAWFPAEMRGDREKGATLEFVEKGEPMFSGEILV